MPSWTSTTTPSTSDTKPVPVTPAVPSSPPTETAYQASLPSAFVLSPLTPSLDPSPSPYPAYDPNATTLSTGTTAVEAIPDNLDPTLPNPVTVQDAINQVADNTTYQINGDSAVVVVGPNNPTVEDQGKVWLRTSPCGAPLAWFRWNVKSKMWRRVIQGLPGEIRIFCGDPSLYFDNTGLGIPTAEWDRWALANGGNGTVGLQDKFIACGQPSGGAWVVNFDSKNTGVSTGGNAYLTIEIYNIPVLTAFLPFNGGFSSGSNFTYPSGGGANDQTYTMAAIGTGPQLPVLILPPFVAEGYVQYIGP